MIDKNYAPPGFIAESGSCMSCAFHDGASCTFDTKMSNKPEMWNENNRTFGCLSLERPDGHDVIFKRNFDSLPMDTKVDMSIMFGRVAQLIPKHRYICRALEFCDMPDNIVLLGQELIRDRLGEHRTLRQWILVNYDIELSSTSQSKFQNWVDTSKLTSEKLTETRIAWCNALWAEFGGFVTM